MKAFDTNYLVRYLVRDDVKQVARVDSFVAEESKEGRQIFLSNLVIVETIWVLESVYEASKKDILNALNGLEAEWLFRFESRDLIKQVIKRYTSGKADFSDYLIDETAMLHHSELLTFDKALIKERKK